MTNTEDIRWRLFTLNLRKLFTVTLIAVCSFAYGAIFGSVRGEMDGTSNAEHARIDRINQRLRDCPGVVVASYRKSTNGTGHVESWSCLTRKEQQ